MARMEPLKNNWGKYARAGVILSLAALMNSCRFGNQVVPAPNPDQISGYYESQPQELVLCSQNSPTASTLCAPMATHRIPAMVGSVMTNPLALIVKDLSTGKAFLVGLTDAQPALPIYVNPDKTLSFIGSTASEILWDSSACTTRIYVEESGSVNPGSGPFTSGSHLQLSGRISLDVDVIRAFEGDCADSLTAMQRCYKLASDCGGSNSSENEQLQAWVQSVFEDSIQAGTLTVDDIPTVTRLAYHVSYR